MVAMPATNEERTTQWLLFEGAVMVALFESRMGWTLVYQDNANFLEFVLVTFVDELNHE